MAGTSISSMKGKFHLSSELVGSPCGEYCPINLTLVPRLFIQTDHSSFFLSEMSQESDWLYAKSPATGLITDRK